MERTNSLLVWGFLMGFLFEPHFMTMTGLHSYSRCLCRCRSHLSVSGGLDVGVALLTDDVVDVVQTIGGDAGKGPGAVGGKVAVGAPRAAEIS